MYKLAIFDMDGTLIDSERKYHQIWTNLLAEVGYENNFDFYRRILGTTSDSLEKNFKEYFGPEIPFAQLFDAFDAHRTKIAAAGDFDLIPGTKEFLQFNQDQKIPMVVATSSPRPAVENILTKLGLIDYFDFIITGDEVTRSKPDPEIYQLTLKKAKVAAQDAIIFEDSKMGILSGHAAGVPIYEIKGMIPLEADIEKLVTESFKDFNEALNFVQK